MEKQHEYVKTVQPAAESLVEAKQEKKKNVKVIIEGTEGHKQESYLETRVQTNAGGLGRRKTRNKSQESDQDDKI